jgi:hypothetical protein
MIQPKYKFGDRVKVTLKSFYNKRKEIAEEVVGEISEIKVEGTSEKDSYRYGITDDMPRCYHRGNTPFIFLMEDEIVLYESQDS